MAVTISDIARLAGISKTTVSLVINGKSAQHRISPQTEARIRQLIKEQGFTPSRLARSIRAQRTETIGLVVPDLVNPFFGQLSYALEQEARRNDLQVLIGCSDDQEDNEADAVEKLLTYQIDGLIVASVLTESKLLAKAYSSIPTVFIDRELAHGNISSVTSDNFRGTYEAAQTFLSEGVRQLVYLGGDQSLSTTKRRWEGFQAALTEHGLPPESCLSMHTDYKKGSGYAMMQDAYHQLNRLPELVFTSAYTLLEEVLEFLKQELGGIPEEVRLGTFDDHPLLDYLPNRVLSIAQDTEGIAREALDLLKLTRAQAPKVEHRLIMPRLIHR